MMDQGPIPSGSVERWDSCSSCPDPFSKSTLKKKERKQMLQKNYHWLNISIIVLSLNQTGENLQGLFSLQHNILI